MDTSTNLLQKSNCIEDAEFDLKTKDFSETKTSNELDPSVRTSLTGEVRTEPNLDILLNLSRFGSRHDFLT